MVFAVTALCNVIFAAVSALLSGAATASLVQAAILLLLVLADLTLLAAAARAPRRVALRWRWCWSRRRRRRRRRPCGARAAGRVAAELALLEAGPVARRLAAHAASGSGATRGVLEAAHGRPAGGGCVVRVAGERGRLGGVHVAVLGRPGLSRSRALQQRGSLGLVGLARAVGDTAIVRQRACGQQQQEQLSQARHGSSGFAPRCL